MVNLNYCESYKLISTLARHCDPAIRILKIKTDARRSNPHIYQLQRLLLQAIIPIKQQQALFLKTGFNTICLTYHYACNHCR